MLEPPENRPTSKLISVTQLLDDVRSNAIFTSDWLFMLLAAALLAIIGLVENSTVLLMASMLMSPLSGPIVAGTLGIAIQDHSLQTTGIKNTCLGLFLCLVLGFVFGLLMCVVDEKNEIMGELPTYEMISRCEYRSLWVGMMVALPSGAALSLSVLGETKGPLIGAAVSASLLSPAVNAGLLWAMALSRSISSSKDVSWLVTRPRELAMLGTASLCVTFVNIVCIYFACIAAFKLKGVHPLDKMDTARWKVKEDLYQPSTKQ